MAGGLVILAQRRTAGHRSGGVAGSGSELPLYVRRILSLYQKLPETMTQPSSRDCLCAYRLQQRGVPLDLIESAFLLIRFFASASETTRRSTPAAHSLAGLLPARDRGAPSHSHSRHLPRIPALQNAAVRRKENQPARIPDDDSSKKGGFR